ncbi:MAG: PadR family transcriptional regulator [Jiangellales bacterium]
MEPGAATHRADPVGGLAAGPAVDAALGRLRRGALEYCVLALLRGGAAYSYDVVRALGSVDGLLTSEGTVYPLLSRLRREGLVSTRWQESPTGPPRRYYELTAQGAEVVESFAAAWQVFRSSVDDVMAGGVSATGGTTTPTTSGTQMTTTTRLTTVDEETS